MTIGEWLALGGFLLSCGSTIAIATWAIGKVNKETAEKFAAEAKARDKAVLAAVEARNLEMEKLRKDWTESQHTQDRNFGEVGLSLRRFIEEVEKEMHAIELWGRDHYVQKPEFEKATDAIRADIKEMAVDIKADFRDRLEEMSKRINGKN